MKKSDITCIVGCTFAAATSFFYFCVMFFGIKVPRYYPTLHQWKWVNEKGIPSQGWYGMQAFAYLTGGIVALAVYFLCKRAASNQAKFKAGTIKTTAVGTLVVILLCMAYMMYHEFAKWIL